MSNPLRCVLAAVVLISLVACDPTYPLFLRNGLSGPITVETRFEGSAPSEGVLQPGERLTFVHPKGEIEHIMVYFEGGKLHELDRQALLNMRNAFHDPRQVTWNIQTDAITPLSRAEVARLDREKE